MAIDYKVLGIQRPGTDDPENLKYYPRPTAAQRVEIEELANEISYSTTLTDVEVEGVIRALIKQMQQHIASGHHGISWRTLKDETITIQKEAAHGELPLFVLLQFM